MTKFSRQLEWSIALAGLALAAVIIRNAENFSLVVAVVTVCLGALVAWIVAQDVKTFTISDSATLTIAILAIAYRWSSLISSGEPTIASCLAMSLDALLPSGMLLLFREIYYRRRGADGLGLGDVKLAAAGGLLIGGVGFSWALFAASLLALGYVGLSRLPYPAFNGRQLGPPLDRADKLAFGAFLAPALWTVWVVEQLPTLFPYVNR